MLLNKKAIFGLTMMSLMSTTALAQELTSDDNSSTVTYKEDYFVQYNPVTLQDMLRSVPGTAALLAQADQEQGGRRVRGFGSAGDQILIDGKRIAGKTNSLGLQLKRIQADTVSHIELIRGTKAGLDVQSEGLIINVVMKESASKSNTVWFTGGEYVDGASVNPILKLNHSGEIDRVKYTLALDSAFRQVRRNFNDTFFFADGTQYQDNALTNAMDQKKAVVNGGIEYNGESGDILRLNGQLEFDTQDTIEIDNQSHLAENTFRVFGDERTLVGGDDYIVDRTTYHRPFHWEFGGDYERRFENAGLLKTLFVINHGKHDFTTIFSSGLNGAEVSEDVTNFSTRTHGEKILRASLTQTFAKVHTIEYGGEVAINDVGTSTQTTRFDDVILPGTNDTDTQEKRAEAFISHNYAIASNISLQSSLNAEFSKITQTDNLNDVPDNSRNFSFWKPRFNLRYDINDQNQIRVTAERKISQLDFGAFGSNFDAEDGETDGGNGELVPEDRLEFSVAYENRFADDQGNIAIRGFFNKIRDHIARIGLYTGDLPAPTNLNQVVTLSVPGNIGDAEEYGVEVNGSLRLKALDLPNAIISGKYILRETEAMDPFLEIERPIQYVQRHEWLVSFQHDLPATGTSYGFNVTNKGPMGPGGGSVGFRTDVIEFWEKTIEPKAAFYVEQLVFGDMKLRFDAKNILNAKYGYDLTKYNGNITLGNVNYNEIREASQQRVFSLTLQGSF